MDASRCERRCDLLKTKGGGDSLQSGKNSVGQTWQIVLPNTVGEGRGSHSNHSWMFTRFQCPVQVALLSGEEANVISQSGEV